MKIHRTFLSAWLLLLISCSLMACTIRLFDFTAISTKNVDVSALKIGQRVTGEDCVPIVLFIPLGRRNWKTAVDAALRDRGDVLIDVVATTKGWWFLFGGETCFEITGAIAQSPSFQPARQAGPS